MRKVRSQSRPSRSPLQPWTLQSYQRSQVISWTSFSTSSTRNLNLWTNFATLFSSSLSMVNCQFWMPLRVKADASVQRALPQRNWKPATRRSSLALRVTPLVHLPLKQFHNRRKVAIMSQVARAVMVASSKSRVAVVMTARTTMRRSSRSCSIKMMRRSKRMLQVVVVPSLLRKTRRKRSLITQILKRSKRKRRRRTMKMTMTI